MNKKERQVRVVLYEHLNQWAKIQIPIEKGMKMAVTRRAELNTEHFETCFQKNNSFFSIWNVFVQNAVQMSKSQITYTSRIFRTMIQTEMLICLTFVTVGSTGTLMTITEH